jgi:hypothetical protein
MQTFNPEVRALLYIRLYTLSEKTVEGRDLRVIQLGPHANGPRPELMPMAKYVANTHGNEAVGREMVSR